jgi:hypothetical protein
MDGDAPSPENELVSACSTGAPWPRPNAPFSRVLERNELSRLPSTKRAVSASSKTPKRAACRRSAGTMTRARRSVLRQARRHHPLRCCPAWRRHGARHDSSHAERLALDDVARTCDPPRARKDKVSLDTLVRDTTSFGTVSLETVRFDRVPFERAHRSGAEKMVAHLATIGATRRTSVDQELTSAPHPRV